MMWENDTMGNHNDFYKNENMEISKKEFLKLNKDATIVIAGTWGGAIIAKEMGFNYSYPYQYVNGNNFFLRAITTDIICFLGDSKKRTHMMELMWKIKAGDDLRMVTLNEI